MSTTTQPDITVVVVTHQGRDKALTALGTARAATGRTSVQWIVVDSGSTDGNDARPRVGVVSVVA